MSWRVTSGLGAWMMQRLSALYMAIFFIYSLVSFLSRESISYQLWMAWVSHPFNNIAIGLFVLALLAHAWVGSRDIILDYVKPFYFRIVKIIVTAFLLIAMGLWAFNILINVLKL